MVASTCDHSPFLCRDSRICHIQRQRTSLCVSTVLKTIKTYAEVCYMAKWTRVLLCCAMFKGCILTWILPRHEYFFHYSKFRLYIVYYTVCVYI